jgi:transcriptional regulator with XRE-family HTH domain
MSEEDQYIKALIERINKLRIKEGLSLGEFALRCKIDKMTAQRISKGTLPNITLRTMHKISKGMDIPLKDLI